MKLVLSLSSEVAKCFMVLCCRNGFWHLGLLFLIKWVSVFVDGKLFDHLHNTLSAVLQVLVLGLLLMSGGMMGGGKALLLKRTQKINFMFISQVCKYF